MKSDIFLGKREKLIYELVLAFLVKLRCIFCSSFFFFLPPQLCNYSANFLSVPTPPPLIRRILILALIRKACVRLFILFFSAEAEA